MFHPSSRNALVFLSLLAACSVVLGHSPLPASAGTLFDLTADWSDAANPNGPWAYREGANLLPHVAAWQGLSGDFTSGQPAWARFEVGTSNLPCIFRSSASVGIAHDWQSGDVICHSTDAFNGIGSGLANITWTSPVTGSVAVSGSIWMGRDIGRGNHWSLSRNGAALTAGDVFSGDAYSRNSPMDFAAGSGGAGALSSIAVSAGDVLALTLTKTASPGDYSGIRMTVELVQPTGVEPGGDAFGVRLDLPSPNPLRARTLLRYALPRATRATLAIYDPAGHRVQTLSSGITTAGEHEFAWVARVPAGLYFVSLETPGHTVTRRVAVIP